MDKISFQGQSKLLFDPKTYKKCLAKTEDAYKHISYKTTRKVPNASVYTAETGSDKIILYMANEKNGLLTTISTTESHPEILENLEIQAKNLLKKAKEKLTVWIIGGDSVKGENGNNMVRTVNEIADILCDRPDIDASILAGHKDGINRVAFHQAGGKLDVIVGKDIKSAEISEEGLASHFDIVELNNVIAG